MTTLDQQPLILPNGTPYIASSEYKRVLDLVLRLIPEPITRLHLREGESGDKRERKVFGCLSINTSGGAAFSAYLIDYNGGEDYPKQIDPEVEFVKGEGFWVGVGTDLFKDFTVSGEKRTKHIWAASYERVPLASSFYIKATDPLFVVNVSASQLLRLSEDANIVTPQSTQAHRDNSGSSENGTLVLSSARGIEENTERAEQYKGVAEAVQKFSSDKQDDHAVQAPSRSEGVGSFFGFKGLKTT